MNTLRGASACLVDEHRRVMMIAREKEPFRGRLAFPGGGVEPSETALEAARRELFEETGHRASGDPVAHACIEIDHDGARYAIDSFAFTEWTEGHSKYATKWLHIDEALEAELAPGMNEALVAFRRALEPSSQ